MLFFIFLALLFLGNYSCCQGKAGIQYRISTEGFNKVAKVLTTQPNGYFVYSNGANAEGQSGAFMYRLNNFRVKEVNITNVSVEVTKDNHLKAEAIISNLELAGHLTLKSAQSGEAIFDETTEVALINNTFTSEGEVEYVGVSGATVMTMPFCDVQTQKVSLSAELLQAVGSSIPTHTLNKIFADAVCSIYKLQFSLGFPNTSLDFDMNLFKIHAAFYPVHLGITNETLLLTYTYDLHLSDAVIIPFDTADNLPPFPPVRETASPFEIWLNNDYFTDFLEDFLKHSLTESGGKIPVNHILPMLPVKGQMKSEDLYIFPQIPKTFPNSTADLYITSANISSEITPEKCLLNLSLILEIQITLNCDRSKVYTPIKFHINTFIPVQFGYNLERITLKYVLFGGNVTVLETTIGQIADESLSQVFLILPQFLGRKVFNNINDDIEGLKLSSLVPVETFLHNITVSAVQGYLIIHGDLTDDSPAYNETNQDLKWIPDYTPEYLRRLWFPLFDDTPKDQKGIAVQDCSIHVSRAYSPSRDAINLIFLMVASIVVLTI